MTVKQLGGPLNLCKKTQKALDFFYIQWYSIEHEKRNTSGTTFARRDPRRHRRHPFRRPGHDLRNAQDPRRGKGRHVLQPPVLGGREEPHDPHPPGEA